MENYYATIKTDIESTFRCASCGAHGDVRLRAVGRSGRTPGRMFVSDDEDAIAAARRAATADIDRDTNLTLPLVACPTCGHRNGRAGPMIRVGSLVLGAVVFGAISGGRGDAALLALTLGAIALFTTYRELGRLTRARSAEFTAFTPGTLPKRPTRPAPPPRTVQVPTTRASAVTPARPSVAVPPAATPAVETAPFFPSPADGGSKPGPG